MHKKIIFSDFYYHLSYIYLSEFYLYFNLSYFSLIPLMASLNILCSDLLSFLNEVTKKNQERETFVAHQKFSEIFRGPLIYA